MKADEDVGIVFECVERTGEEFEVGVVVTGKNDLKVSVVPQDFGDVLGEDEVILFFGTDADVGTTVIAAVTGIEDDDDFLGCGMSLHRERGNKGEEKRCYYNKGSDSAQNGAV